MKLIEKSALDQLSQDAARRPRLRANWNIHPTLDDPIQRFFNAMEPHTYVRPHYHDGVNAWEAFLVVRGTAAVVTFTEDGLIKDRVLISSHGDNLGLEIPRMTWHSLVSLEAGTILFELKHGPYNPNSDKNFAAWAPEEGHETCASFEAWFREGEIGSKAPV